MHVRASLDYPFGRSFTWSPKTFRKARSGSSRLIEGKLASIAESDKDEQSPLDTQTVQNLQTNPVPEGWENIPNGSNSLDARANVATYASLLRRCGIRKALAEVEWVHGLIVTTGLEQNPILGKLLLQMYGNCGATRDAIDLFSKITHPDSPSWNFAITSCAKKGQSKEALQLFQQVQMEGSLPDKFMFASILSAWSTDTTLAGAKMMHARIAAGEFESDIVIATALVNMYGKHGDLEEAKKTFDNIFEQDVVSWNAMIAIYSQHEQGKQALEYFGNMQEQGVMPNKWTFVSVLSVCAYQATLKKGKQMHAQIVAIGFDLDLVVGTALVNMYGKCGRLQNARRMFDEMLEQDVILWNAMIAAYAQNGHGKDALHLAKQMQRQGVTLAKATFVTILDACTDQAELIEGKHVHELLVNSGYESDVVVGTALVNLYGKCGGLEDALLTFNKIPIRNVVSWNAMIVAFVENAQGNKPIELFEQMQCEGVIPDKVTFVCILHVCASHAMLFECKQMHSRIASSYFESDAGLGAAIVNMYGKCGGLNDAQTVFDRTPKQDAILWTALIAAYDQHEQWNIALQLFYQMKTEGVMPDAVAVVSIVSAFGSQGILTEAKWFHACIAGSRFESNIDVQNALVSMYGKCGSLEEACITFARMHERNVISWNAMIAVCAENEQSIEALQVYKHMDQEGVMPNKVAHVTILDVCANHGALLEGKRIHACIAGMGSGFESDADFGAALVNVYGKCGKLERAWEVFNMLSQHNVFSWTAMIAACALHGKGKDALQLFHKMQLDGMSPNRVTFIKILSACSHAGLVDEACYFFDSMNQSPDIIPLVDHYNCMVDLFGRTGRLDEAEVFINTMPAAPNAVTWSTLLGACKTQADLSRGEHAANRVVELDPDNAAPYITLSNIYVAAGREPDAETLAKRMRDRGLKMTLAWSSPDYTVMQMNSPSNERQHALWSRVQEANGYRV